MLKIVFNPRTCDVVGAYGEKIKVNWPYLMITEAEWGDLQGKKLKVLNGELTVIPEPEKILAEYDKAMEEHIYNVRAARGYTTREPGVYINSTVSRWKADAEVWCAWLDTVMQYSLDILNTAKETGVIPPLDEYLTKCPEIVWTEE